jgi:hypothetical protein
MIQKLDLIDPEAPVTFGRYVSVSDGELGPWVDE